MFPLTILVIIWLWWSSDTCCLETKGSASTESKSGPMASQGSAAISSSVALPSGSLTSILAIKRLQPSDTCGGIEYLQSMIIVKVSLSFASWKGAWPHTSMYKITPSDQTSENANWNDEYKACWYRWINYFNCWYIKMSLI